MCAHGISVSLLLSGGGLCAIYSFPTRRSSDLQNDHAIDIEQVCFGELSRRLRCLGCSARWSCHAPKAAKPSTKLRSEEHTSELQSRLHLVCRLLLEKKKAT